MHVIENVIALTTNHDVDALHISHEVFTSISNLETGTSSRVGATTNCGCFAGGSLLPNSGRECGVTTPQPYQVAISRPLGVLQACLDWRR